MRKETISKAMLYFAKFSLATAFLSAVADRFGLWGNMGDLGISWGTMENFYVHVAKLCPWAPNFLVPILGWLVNIVELLLGIALLCGIKPKFTALSTTILLFVFAASMAAFQSVKLMLNFSVLTCAACAIFVYFSSDCKFEEKSDR
ncbi:DoxX family protein [Xenorhabdus nematophila]|uniref:hypothetical protein n=1 Tax=Xenorhabdus nematophila TaxID=628 RepID=UPI0003275787|nr:hypothetical protein [Xenorhabdus nematophila]CEF29452.1 DoxX family protein [Xenorhabdus nematophila str. Websteri]KHD27588.1 DoxX family protein [Xenorhabdus nematophila]MBA0018827.1 DoxX family protein [Xenorhabdus nematophila]MCB4426536.1 DoxX family protein [Xenorhabdus nematophila]CCW28984.1 DoxX family protein [Xenorhabdus nematophila F1]